MLKVDKGDISFFVNCRYRLLVWKKLVVYLILFFRLVSYF